MNSTKEQERKDRAQKLRVFKVNEKEYFVENSSGQISYKVCFKNSHAQCTCADYVENAKKDPEFKCKHIMAVLNGNGNFLQDRPRLNNQFITEIQGREFVVYSGLLDLAHQKGLKGIEVCTVQYPNKENGFEAICKAIAESSTCEKFVEIGDANPRNVNKKVANHILRMAATRAKARCLRDLTNIGMTALEELGDEYEEQTSTSSSRGKKGGTRKKKEESSKSENDQSSQTSNGSKKPVGQQGETNKSSVSNQKNNKGDQANTNNKPSQAQKKAIENLAVRRGLTDEDLDAFSRENIGVSFPEISSEEAASLIKSLQRSA